MRHIPHPDILVDQHIGKDHIKRYAVVAYGTRIDLDMDEPCEIGELRYTPWGPRAVEKIVIERVAPHVPDMPEGC